MSSHARFRASVRRTVTVAVAATLALGAVQPAVFADPVAERAERPADPDPRFLEPAGEPENSVVHPTAPPAPEAAASPTGRAAAANGERAWETHGESRPDHAGAAALARQSGKRVLVSGKLAEDSTTYANPDGTATTEITSGPNRVRRGDGWADVDTTLVRRGNRWEAAAVVGHLSLSAGGDRSLLTAGRGAHAFSVEWPTVLPEPRIEGATATYAGVATGVDLVIRALRYGYEQDIVLHERPDGAVAFEMPLRLTGRDAAKQTEQGIEIVDGDGDYVGRLPRAVMFDAQRDPRSDRPVHQELVATTLVERAGELAVRYAPRASFLTDPGTVYPVTIDPAATLGLTTDTYVDSAYPTMNYQGTLDIHVGSYNGGGSIDRSFISFGTSAIAGVDVLSAYLKLYEIHSYSCQDRYMVVRAAAHSSTATTWNNQPAWYAQYDPETAFAHGYNSTCPDAWESIPATNLVQQWADNGSSSAALGLRALSETDSYAYKRFNSGNAGSGHPYVSVTYNSIPTVSSLSPAAGATVNDLTPNLSGIVSDDDGGSVTGQFYVKNSAGAWVTNGAQRTGTAGTRIVYTVESGKLQDGQTYSWAMRACDGTNCSATTTYRSFTVNYGPPGAPATVTATSGDSTTTVTWTAPTDNGGSAVTGYRCDLHHASNGAVYATKTVGLVTTCTDDTVTNGTSYYWRVYAINAVGTGTYRQSSTVTPSRVPTAPINVEATAGNATARVTWDPPASDGGSPVLDYTARLYQVGVVTPVYTSPAVAAASPREAATGGLTNGTSYYWTVTARNVRGSDAGSTATSEQVVPATVPGTPGNVDATEHPRPNGEPVAFTVVWSTPSTGGADIQEYLVQAYEQPSNEAVLEQPVTACGACNTAEVSGLQPDRRYKFGVIARNRIGTGGEGFSTEKTSHLPPTVTKAVEHATESLVERPGTDEPVASRGDAVRFTITVTNTQAQPAQVDTVVDTLPPGVEIGQVLIDGTPCADSCGLNGRTLTLAGGYQLAAGATRTYQYVGVLTGGERACLADAVNTVVARGPYGFDDGTAATTACGSALGLEPWWTYVGFPVAAQSAASVNVANGNLVVQATDGEHVQAHGRLAYVLRRSYNSQAVSLADLPGSIGAGWLLNVGQTGDLAGTGVTATGLRVPRLGEAVGTLTEPLSVTLIDRDGTRHLFAPKRGLPALRVSGLTGASAALAPAALAAPAGKELCVDQAYDAPPGVHLGLWRYLAVDTSASGDPCGNVGTGAPLVVGYAAMRPDRLRTEFNVFGQLVEMRDAAGVALRYTYEEPSAQGLLGRPLSVFEPRSCTPDATNSGKCRQLTFSYPSSDVTVVTDPAGRRTRYEFAQRTVAGVVGTVRVLRRVVNEPELRGDASDHVEYWYEGDTKSTGAAVACGGSALQLCTVVDARGNDSSFHYDSAGSGTAGLAGIGRIDRVTDRRGTGTTVSYPAPDRTVTVRGGSRQKAFSAIDQYGRVGQQADGPVGDATSAAYPALHLTTTTWDTDTGCPESPARRDNNVCSRVRRGSANTGNSGTATPDEQTTWRYDDQGNVLRERRVLRAAGNAGAPVNLDTTSGYRTQYLGSDSSGTRSTPVATSSTGAGGAVSTAWTGSLNGLVTLYAVSDRVESLSPRGNAASATAVARYRTALTVDANESVAPGVAPGGAVCSRAADAPSFNTGLVCAERVPYGAESASTVAVTKHSYDAFGQRTSKLTPRGGEYEYLYFGDDQRELSGSVSAGGWLRAVTDPAGDYVAFAHDRAGHVVRTWDRDATPAGTTAAAFDVYAGPPGFAETLYGTGTFADAVRLPWRFPRRQQTPTGDVTRLDVDQHGNVGRLVPPRGKGAATSPFDTVTTYDPEGRPESVKRGQDAPSTMRYDAFGNLVEQRDASGSPTVLAYDEVDRLVKRTTLRGDFPTTEADAPTACRPATTSADTIFGAGKLVCSETTAYDTVDNVVVTTDKDGQPTLSEYDSVHRKTAVVTRRSATKKLRAQTTYDADGNVVAACTPRQFPGGEPGTCDASSVYATQTAYDVAGRPVATTTHRTATEALTARTTYDAEGNATAIADARQETESGDHTVDQAFDLLGRRVTADVPRAGVTTFQYSPSGDLLAEVAPGAVGDNVGSGGAGRAVRITGYTYDASHRVLDTVRALQVAAADPAVDRAAVAAAIGTATTDEAAQTNIRTRRVYDEAGNVVGVYSPRAFVAGSVAAPDNRYLLRTAFDDSDRPVTQWAPRAEGGANGDLTGDPTQAAQCPATGAPAAGDPLAYPQGLHVCVSTMTYDADGRVAQVTLPSATADQTPRRLVYAYTEDNLVRETKAPDPENDGELVAVSTVLHDGVGRAVKTTNAEGRVTLTAYTADGLVASVRGPGAAGLTHDVEYEYDDNGNRLKEVTPRPRADDRPYTETVYYADNRVRAVYAGGNDTQPTPLRGDIVTSYEYDANGNATKVTSPSANARDDNNLGGVPTVNTYTPDNLVLQTTQPVVVTAAGATQSRVTAYGYDAAGRKTSVDVDLTGTPAVDGAPQTFTYFPTGLVATQSGRGGGETIAHRYDATGALVSAVDTGSGTSRTTTADHYLDGLPRRVTSDGRVTAYAYDGSGARTALGEGTTGQPLDVTRYAVNDAGLPVSMTAGDSGTIGWTYNSLGQVVTETRGSRTQTWTYRTDDLLDKTVVRAGAVDLASYSYEYDELSRQTRQAYYGKAAGGPLGDVSAGSPVAYTYAYDRAGRLSSFTDARGTRTVTFDHDGNRTDYGTGLQPGATKFTYRADDSIATSVTGATTRTYQYAKPFGGVTNDGCATYDYDGLDRLVLVDAPSTPPVGCATGDVSYRYDGLDRQVRRTVGSESVSLHYDGLGQSVLLQTGAASGGLRYTVDPSGAVKTVRRGSGAVEHLANDGTGSTGLVTSADAVVLCTARYDAYGNPDGNTPVEPAGSCNTGSAQADVFYRGNRKDTTTGQYQLGARTYDPAKAGFLTPDVYRVGDAAQNPSVGTDPLTANTYSYVNGDPVNYTDPTGHEPHWNGSSWTGRGCSTGDCTPQAAAARERRRDADEARRMGDARGLGTDQRLRIMRTFFGAHPGSDGEYGYGLGLIQFTQWEINSGRIGKSGAGSAWWRTVNGMMMLDIEEANRLIEEQGGSAVSSSDAVNAWLQYARVADSEADDGRKQAALWQAHQLSLHAGIRASKGLLAKEPKLEQHFVGIVVENVDVSAFVQFPSDLDIGIPGMPDASMATYLEMFYPASYPIVPDQLKLAHQTRVRPIVEAANPDGYMTYILRHLNPGLESTRWG